MNFVCHSDLLELGERSTRVFDSSDFVLYSTAPNGNCMYSALYAKGAMMQHPACGFKKVDTMYIYRGKPVEDEMDGVTCVRSEIAKFLTTNKLETIPKGIVSERIGGRGQLPNWERLFENVWTSKVEVSYDERVQAIGDSGTWGSNFELLAAKAMGLQPRVVVGEDRKALQFQNRLDDTDEVLESEPVLWYHSQSGTGKADHYDVLMSENASVLRVSEIFWLKWREGGFSEDAGQATGVSGVDNVDGEEDNTGSEEGPES